MWERGSSRALIYHVYSLTKFVEKAWSVGAGIKIKDGA